MLVTVPQTLAIFPYGPLTGLDGLGDDGSVDTIIDPSTGITYDLSGNVVNTLMPPITPINALPISLPSQDLSDLGISQSQLQSVLAGSSAPTQQQLQNVIQKGTNSGLSPTQISQIINGAINAGVSVFKATSSPAVIPGTNLVYNPATGAIQNATTGLTGSQLAATAGVGGVSIATIAMIGGLGVLALLLLRK